MRFDRIRVWELTLTAVAKCLVLTQPTISCLFFVVVERRGVGWGGGGGGVVRVLPHTVFRHSHKFGNVGGVGEELAVTHGVPVYCTITSV